MAKCCGSVRHTILPAGLKADQLEVPPFIKLYGPKPHSSQQDSYQLCVLVIWKSKSTRVLSYYQVQSANFVARQLGPLLERKEVIQLTRVLTEHTSEQMRALPMCLQTINAGGTSLKGPQKR